MDMDNLVVGRSIFGIYAYKDEGFVQDEKIFRCMRINQEINKVCTLCTIPPIRCVLG